MVATAPPRPAPSTILDHNIPAELRTERRWVCWRYELRDDGWTKVPANPVTGENARSTAPATWGTFDQARAGAGRFGLDGIGFMLGDGWAGLDIDDCRDPATGIIDAPACHLIQRLWSYAEVSPSQCGVKMLMRGTLPPGRRRTGNLELYDRARFFTITGRLLPSGPTTVAERTEALASLHADLFPQRPPAPPRSRPPAPAGSTRRPDDVVITRIRQSAQGAKFDRLMAGDLSAYGGNWSRADEALCSILAFWTNRDPAQVESIWRQSKLADRDKWDRADYRERTIAAALDFVTECYEWPEDQPRLVGLGADQAAAPAPDLAACQAEVAYWKDQALRYKAERDEARATIRAMRAAMANDRLGPARFTAIAAAFETAALPDHRVDVQTGEVLATLRDESGAVKVYLGNGSEDETGRPTAGLAAAAGRRADATSRDLKALQKAGLVTVETRKPRGADGSLKTETWLNWPAWRPPADAPARPPKVQELLMVIAKAGAPDDASRHGDPERFKSTPVRAACPLCGSEHVTVECHSCERTTVQAPSPQDADPVTAAPPSPSSVVNTSIGLHDADPVASPTTRAVARRRRHLRAVEPHVPPPPVRPRCQAPNCRELAADDDAYCESCRIAGWADQVDAEPPPAAPEASAPPPQPHAHLWRQNGKRVHTPRGPGRLEYFRADQAAVTLEAEPDRLSYFPPAEVQPAETGGANAAD